MPITNRLLIACLSLMVMSAAGCASRQPAGREPLLGLSHETAPAGVESGKSPNANEEAAPVVASREPWRFADHDGLLITTRNYRIYTTIDNNNILERLPTFYELALEHYTTALAPLPKPDVPLETYLFQSRSQWQTKTQEMLPDQARMFSNLGRGGFTTRGTSVLYYIDRGGYPRDTFAIAAHEGWHQYTQQTFRHQLPIWLEEGIATYMEGYRNNREGLPEFLAWANGERRLALRDAVRANQLIPLDDLLTRTPQSFLDSSKDQLLTYYAQVWALTRFLSEGENGRYREALAAVLTDAAGGKLVGRMLSTDTSPGSRRQAHAGATRAGPAVAREYFNRDLPEFERQYLAFVNQLLQSNEFPSRNRGRP